MARTTVTKICIENSLDYLVAKVYPADGATIQLTLLETDYGAFRAARRVEGRVEYDAFLSDRWSFIAPDGNTNRNGTVKSGYLIRGANDAFEREGSFNYLYGLIPLVAFFCLNIIYCIICLLYVFLEVIVEVKKPGGSSAGKDRIGRLEAMLEPFNFEKEEEEAVDESRWKNRNEDADFLVDSKTTGIQAKKSFYKKGGRSELTTRARTCILIVETLGVLTLTILSALNLLNFVGMFVHFRNLNTNRMFPQDSALKGFMSIPIINAVVLAASLFFCFLHLITRGKKCRAAGCILFSGYPLAILTNAAFIPFQVYFNWFGPWFY